MKKVSLFILFALCATWVQAKVVKGTVRDQAGEPVISASAVVKGTVIGTVTDIDGFYTLEVPEDAQTLVFSYLGMQSEEVAITGDVASFFKNINISGWRVIIRCLVGTS